MDDDSSRDGRLLSSHHHFPSLSKIESVVEKWVGELYGNVPPISHSPKICRSSRSTSRGEEYLEAKSSNLHANWRCSLVPLGTRLLNSGTSQSATARLGVVDFLRRCGNQSRSGLFSGSVLFRSVTNPARGQREFNFRYKFTSTTATSKKSKSHHWTVR